MKMQFLRYLWQNENIRQSFVSLLLACISGLLSTIGVFVLSVISSIISLITGWISTAMSTAQFVRTIKSEYAQFLNSRSEDN